MTEVAGISSRICWHHAGLARANLQGCFDTRRERCKTMHRAMPHHPDAKSGAHERSSRGLACVISAVRSVSGAATTTFARVLGVLAIGLLVVDATVGDGRVGDAIGDEARQLTRILDRQLADFAHKVAGYR
jgi:hypothetical protein